MGYLSPTALKHLRIYAYKGVDEYVTQVYTIRIAVLTTPQVFSIQIRPWPLLELVRHPLAVDNRAEYSTLSNQTFSTGGIDMQRR